MKKLILAIIIIAAFASCEKSLPAQSSTTSSNGVLIRLQVVAQDGTTGYAYPTDPFIPNN